SPGRKNSLRYEIDGSSAAAAWDSERPDELWIGHRGRTNEVLLRDPAILNAEGRRATGLPGGHAEGYADTFKALYAAVYRAVAVAQMLRQLDLEISALAFYPNNLDPDEEAREIANAHLRRVIEAAQRLEVGIVGTFVGRDQHLSVDVNLEDFKRVWPPLVRFAREHDVTIAIENCPMIFSADEWPGGRNLAYSPAIWRRMFEIVPDDNFGLNLDPSHLVWQFIDYTRAVRDFASRIFHVHAKDMEIDRDGLYEQGVMSLGVGWQVLRLPGLGEVRWGRFIGALYAAGEDWGVWVVRVE